MNYPGSNYQILENRKTSTGELNSVIGSTMSNSLRVNYSSSDESRPQSDVLFPFVDILPGRHRLHLVRQRAVHAEQRAALQLVRGQERLHQVQHQARADVRRPHRALPLRQRVLQLLQAGRLGLQQPRRLLHRRARRAGQPEPHRVAGDVAQVPGALHEHPRPRQAEPAADRALRRRLRAGRVASAQRT